MRFQLQHETCEIANFLFHTKKIGCVSFMLPVFNKARYLNRSIGSILRQDYYCLEVIAIDDGSTDNSFNILKYWMKQDNRVIVHKFEKNKGLVPARIQGVLLSYYDYLHPIDPDDELPANCLKGFINYALQTNSDMVMGKILKRNYRGTSNYGFKMVREYMNKTQMVARFTACTMNWNLIRLFKRKVFLPAVQLLIDKFYLPIIYAEDKLIMGVVILFSNNFSYYSKPTYIYYTSLPDNSLSSFYSNRKYTNSQSANLVSAILRTLYPKLRC